MRLALATRTPGSVPDAVARVRTALADQGFGILTEIDMAATLRTKIDAALEDYIILGACHPPMAYRAVTADKQVGLLLPCNVVVRSDPDEPGSAIVEAMNPQIMSTVVDDNPALAEVADEVTQLLQKAIDAL